MWLWMIACGGSPPTCGFEAGTNDECQALCDAGDAAACARLGSRLMDAAREAGQEAFTDGAIALERRACDLGDGGGCYLVGHAVEPKDAREGFALYVQGCKLGMAAACGDAGARLEALGTDRTAWIAAYQRGCDGGDIRSCAWIGDAIATGQARAAGDADEAALGAWRKSCRGADFERCQAIGSHLSTRRYDVYAPERAVSEATADCYAGDGISCLRLSVYTEAGWGTAADAEAARRLVAQAKGMARTATWGRPPIDPAWIEAAEQTMRGMEP